MNVVEEEEIFDGSDSNYINKRYAFLSRNIESNSVYSNDYEGITFVGTFVSSNLEVDVNEENTKFVTFNNLSCIDNAYNKRFVPIKMQNYPINNIPPGVSIQINLRYFEVYPYVLQRNVRQRAGKRKRTRRRRTRRRR